MITNTPTIMNLFGHSCRDVPRSFSRASMTLSGINDVLTDHSFSKRSVLLMLILTSQASLLLGGDRSMLWASSNRFANFSSLPQPCVMSFCQSFCHVGAFEQLLRWVRLHESSFFSGHLWSNTRPKRDRAFFLL